MKSKTVLILVGVFVVALGFYLFRPSAKVVTQVNNSTCPVSGNPVNDRDTYTHNGKEYRLCDEGCKKPLSENPDKYLSE